MSIVALDVETVEISTFFQGANCMYLLYRARHFAKQFHRF